MRASMTRWFVYVLRCGDGALYTGIATDVERRLGEHRAGKGAKALRGRGPLELVATCVVEDHGSALRVEHRFKRLPKARKEALARERALESWAGGELAAFDEAES